MFPNFFTNVTNSLIIPSAGACFYLFIYPHIAKFIFKVWQRYIADKEKIHQKIKAEVPITEAKARELQQALASTSIEFESLLSDKSERIKQLEDRDDKNIVRLEEKDKKINELTESLKKNELELRGYKNRAKVLSDMKLRPDRNGTLLGQCEHYCSKCFYSEPLKIIKISEFGTPGIYNECPVCSAKYTHKNFNDDPSNKSRFKHKIDNLFLCWTTIDGKNKICPSCANTDRAEDSILAKVSEDKYVCVLCDKEYNRVTPIEDTTEDNPGS